MPRNLETTLAQDIASGSWSPALLAGFAFRNETVNCWSGGGDLAWNGMTFKGIGTLGSVGISGSSGDVAASGATVGLSGVDATVLGETLTDLQVEAKSTLWLASWRSGAVRGTPYVVFSGGTGQPEIVAGIPTPSDPSSTDKFRIILRLETRMKQLARANLLRYTAADQHLFFPDDCGFNWVEIQNDIALVWG